MADSNSSDDVEVDQSQLNQNRFKHKGQKVIEEITKDAQRHRIESKQAWDSISFGSGNIIKQGTQWKWINQFNACRTAVFGQSLATPPNGQTILRGLTIALTKIDISQYPGKTGPSYGYVQFGYKTLVDYCEFTYDDFKLETSASKRIEKWFQDRLRSGELVKGVWNPTIPIGFNTALRMNYALFTDAMDNGVRNWDIVVMQMLSLSLLCATGGRAGDVGVSAGYEQTMCLQWKDVELYWDSEPKSGASMADLYGSLVCRIKLRFLKNMK